MPPQSDCRYMAMRAIPTLPAISSAPISPAIFTSRGDFLGGIGPARESNPLLRTCPGVAIPLGRLNPSHRRVALPLLRDATGPAHFQFACRPDCLEGRFQSPSPLDDYQYTRPSYIWQGPIVYRVASPRYRRNRHIGRRTGKRQKGDPPSLSPDGPPCHIRLAVPRIG